MLDELRLLVVVDNETDTLSSVDDGVPQAPELAHLLQHGPRHTDTAGRTCVTAFEHLCLACHGFSVLATGRRGDTERSILFDTGPDPEVWLGNARRLDVDLAAIEVVFLSHWHFDHSGALPGVLAAIAQARRDRGHSAPVVDLHPDRPDRRGIQLQSGVLAMLPDEPTFEAMEAAGAKLARRGEAHALCEGFFHASGVIPRQTDYETGLAGHHSYRGDEGTPDPLIMDERFVAAAVTGRGVTVLSACSHAGVVNACLAAQEAFPSIPIDVVLGGYHLAGAPMEPRIDPTVRDLRERIGPKLVAPGHCTGWRAKAALAAAFAPGRYAPSVVGTRYVLRPAGPGGA